LDKQDWDASVKQLVSTPTVLAMMNNKLDWTEKLGDAVLAQQADGMDAIQRLRAKAQANGKLETTKQQKVTGTQEANAPVITIEPASPEVYRFRYKGSDHTIYVGVMAQEVQKIEPGAVWRDQDGYLRGSTMIGSA
jgi:Protein of unknown function (DUF3300)